MEEKHNSLNNGITNEGSREMPVETLAAKMGKLTTNCEKEDGQEKKRKAESKQDDRIEGTKGTMG